MVRVTGGGGVLGIDGACGRGSRRGPGRARHRTDAAAADDSPARWAADGCDGRTGCDGSGRGPPIGACGRGIRAGDAAGRPDAGAPGAPDVSAGAGLLRFPVAAGGGVVDTGGRTSSGRRGGAGGAWPVFGSSTRSRSVGGTMRPGTGAGRTRRRAAARPPRASDGPRQAPRVGGRGRRLRRGDRGWRFGPARRGLDGPTAGQRRRFRTGGASTSGGASATSGSADRLRDRDRGRRFGRDRLGSLDDDRLRLGRGRRRFDRRGRLRRLDEARRRHAGAAGLAGSGARPPGFFSATAARGRARRVGERRVRSAP